MTTTEDADLARTSDRLGAMATQWPRLHRGEIHVWKSSLDGAASGRDYALLSLDETERAGRYRFERDRGRFVTGRTLLRKILGGYLGRRPSELGFDKGPHGKPRLILEENETPLHFNVSHADSLVLHAVTRDGALGVDVERVRELPDWAQIAESVFTPEERMLIDRQSPDQRMMAFFQAWTRREAMGKACGDGLAGEPRACARSSACTFHFFNPAPGFLATLAYEFPARRVVFLTGSGSSESGVFEKLELKIQRL